MDVLVNGNLVFTEKRHNDLSAKLPVKVYTHRSVIDVQSLVVNTIAPPYPDLQAEPKSDPKPMPKIQPVPPKDKQYPMPGAEAQAKAEKTIHEMYKKEYGKGQVAARLRFP